MNKPCLFCQIVAGEIPSFKLWEDDNVLVILDAFPVTVGHTLVIPKFHYRTIEDMEPEAMTCMHGLPAIVGAVRRLVDADGINVWQNNGPSAGQRVEHVHFHLIPRFDGDKLFRYPGSQKLDSEEATRMVRRFQLEKDR